MKSLVGKAAMHILIVEDDPVVADVLGMTLEEAGHFQSTAHNIETALAELKHNTVDAVLRNNVFGNGNSHDQTHFGQRTDR